MRRAIVGLASTVLFISGPLSSASAVDNPLDTSFNASGPVPGIYATDFGGNWSYAKSVLIDSQGRIVAGGRAQISGDSSKLVRFSSNGTLDTTFGVNGIATTSFGGLSQMESFIFDSQGRILAAGVGLDPSLNTSVILVRYTSEGILDSSFGTSGKVTVAVTQINALAVDSLGRIIAGGYGYDNLYNHTFKVVRYTSAGVLDATFGVNGIATTDVTNGEINAIAVDGLGRIVAGGRSLAKLAVARYTTSGVLDVTFGTNGITMTTADNSAITSLVLDDQGRIVVGGGYAHISAKLARYTSDGLLDTSFGTSGIVTPPNLGSLKIAIDNLGGILIGGVPPSGAVKPYTVARYTSEGILDSSFGTSGVKSIEVGTSESSFFGRYPNINSLAVDGQGNIALAGDGKFGSKQNFIVVRLLGPPVAAVAAPASSAAADAAAAARREAEKRAARLDMSNKFRASEKVSIDTFREAEIFVSQEYFEKIQAEILSLPELSRADILQVIKIAFKYEVVSKVASDKVKTVYSKDLVSVGLIPVESTHKATLTAILRKVPASLRSDYATIKATIDAEVLKIQNRKNRLATVLGQKGP